MIYSNSFPTTPGLNYVDDASFFAATIYGVKRSGRGLSRVTGSTVPVNDQYNLIGSRIYVDPANPFNAGEILWVMYNNLPPYVPPPCISVGIDSSPVYLPDAIVGAAYTFVMTLTGTAPFALAAIVKPAWMAIAISGSTVVFSGTPAGGDVSSSVAVSFNVTNCSAGTVSYSDTIRVIAAGSFGNFVITNDVPFGTNVVKNIFPIPPPFWTFISGSMPVTAGNTATGYMTLAVSAAVGVFVICDNPFNYLELYKNGVLVGSVFAPLSGTYYFPVTSFAITDDMDIMLKNN